MATHPIRIFGDPVLRQATEEITNVDGSVARLADDMIQTMYEAPGVGLAANQIGVERRMFVYDIGDGPGVVCNPRIVEAEGEWSYKEGCLSVPDLSFDIVRPKQVRLLGVGLDGEEVDIEADELLARCFQHEVDHLDGILLLQRLEPDQRKQAMRVLRQRALGSEPADDPDDSGER
ncbi:MAG TPA: peptide deformylase [Acidimicrobiales bacterium]|nr:peptide deformylase [Acidimicrobiales bacterium]